MPLLTVYTSNIEQLVTAIISLLRIDQSTFKAFPAVTDNESSSTGGSIELNQESSLLILPFSQHPQYHQSDDMRKAVSKQQLILHTTNLQHTITCVQNDSGSLHCIQLLSEYNAPSLGKMGIFKGPDEIEILIIEPAAVEAAASGVMLYYEWLMKQNEPSFQQQASSSGKSAEGWKLWNDIESDDDNEMKQQLDEKTSSESEDWIIPEGTFIPKLRCEMLSKGSNLRIPLNARQPIPFRNNIFEGHLVLIVHTSRDDEEPEPYKSKFQSDTKNRFEVQVQGKFTQKPTGTLFLGAEITKKMELGMLTKGICSSILSMLRSYNPFVHYSFGDSMNNELPHITSPLWSSADRLIITPPNQTPPSLIEPFEEDMKIKKARKSKPDYTVEVDLESTYSISFKTSKMDLEKWAVVNMPLVKAMDLHTFWADADLRFVAYMVPANALNIQYDKNGLPIKHPIKELDYFFAVEVKHETNNPQWNNEVLLQCRTPNERQQVKEGGGGQVVEAYPTGHERLKIKRHISHEENGEESDDDVAFFDALEGEDKMETSIRSLHHPSFVDVPSEDESSESKPSVSDDGTNDQESVTSSLTREFLGLKVDATAAAAVTKPIRAAKRNSNASRNGKPQLFSDLRGASRRVLATVEVDDLRNNRKTRRILFLFNSITEGISVLHSYGEWQASGLPLPKLMWKPPKYSRMSDMERRRYHLDTVFGSSLAEYQDLSEELKYKEFFNNATVHNNFFLTGTLSTATTHGVGNKKLRIGLPNFIKESFVCVQLGNHYWSEELLGLAAGELIFIKQANKGGAERVRIPLITVLSVNAVPAMHNPLPVPDCYCFIIATFSRRYCIIIRGEEQRDSWVEAIDTAFGECMSLSDRGSFFGITEATNVNSVGSLLEQTRKLSINIDPDYLQASQVASDPSVSLTDLVSYPKDYSIGDKMILNGRNFVFESTGILYAAANNNTVKPSRLPQLLQLAQSDPLLLVEKLLAMAFELSAIVNDNNSFDDLYNNNISSSGRRQHRGSESVVSINEGMSPEVEQLWIDFMDGLSLLQYVDIRTVNKNSSNSLNDNDLEDNTMRNDEKECNTSSAEVLCLFLNLYHCLLIHSFLVVGLPTTLFRWSSFFRNCSYEAFSDIFSLAELEHCIIRHGMSRPGINFLAQLLIPKLEFEFQSTARDYRLLWAINCCSESNISKIPIYTPNKLNEQLEYVIRNELEKSMRVKRDQIVLPIICQWYLKEFEYNFHDGNRIVPLHTNINNRKLLEVLLVHLRGDLKEAVEDFLQRKKGNIQLKYSSLDFKCRFPQQLNENDYDFI